MPPYDPFRLRNSELAGKEGEALFGSDQPPRRRKELPSDFYRFAAIPVSREDRARWMHVEAPQIDPESIQDPPPDVQLVPAVSEPPSIVRLTPSFARRSRKPLTTLALSILLGTVMVMAVLVLRARDVVNALVHARGRYQHLR
jgi:hypothetical protein